MINICCSDYPYIYPNYFFDDADLKTLVEGVKIAVAVSQTHSMQRFGSKLIAYKWPGCAHIQSFTDEFWECMIRQYSATGMSRFFFHLINIKNNFFNCFRSFLIFYFLNFSVYHPVGTCKMGPYWDKTAVVEYVFFGTKLCRFFFLFFRNHEKSSFFSLFKNSFLFTFIVLNCECMAFEVCESSTHQLVRTLYRKYFSTILEFFF